jgi:lipopolysaccharide/colanic/teichoic acid biosynthesis glycosyltransferase
MLKRLFDILFSFFALVVLSPLLLIIALLVLVTSPGGIFFLQERVGRDNKNFKLFKFRTMRANADKEGLITIGARDSRVTKTGYYLRKYKIDELPQLLNVLLGDMSVVGPRPEVRKYVDLYTDPQKKVLDVKPGITDYASLQYFNENELLASSADPENTYIKEILPKKLELNNKYISEANLLTDFRIIFSTVKRIFG